MKLLAIDTSTERASVALAYQGEIYSEDCLSQRQHAKVLLPMIERLLAEGELPLSQLDAIVYGCGPGSFTGLRIACSVAKGLAFAQDLPLIAVSSLAAIADEAKRTAVNDQAIILAVLDARMNQLYWACFADEWEESAQVSYAADIKISGTTPIIIAGVGYETYLEQMPLALCQRVDAYCTIYPHAQAMIRLALQGKMPMIDAADALPVYVRNQVTRGDFHG